MVHANGTDVSKILHLGVYCESKTAGLDLTKGGRSINSGNMVQCPSGQRDRVSYKSNKETIIVTGCAV